MLRLLPERLYAGLFGQQAWLSHGASGVLSPAPATLPAGAALPDVLDALLETTPPRRRAGKLSVMLPSQSVRCLGLPWSPHLRNDEERNAYALAHLEQAGLGASDSQVVHTEFRHYGAQGLTYAVPRQLLHDLHTVATRHRMDLTTALPVGGVAHLAARRAYGTGLELVLIAEEPSISALALSRTGLERYDAEPVVGGQREALRRLLTRLVAYTAEFKGITLCADHDEDGLANIAGTFVAQVAVQRVKSSQWRRFL